MRSDANESELQQLERLLAEAKQGKRWTGLTLGRQNISGEIERIEAAIYQLKLGCEQE
jgi:hypothetical protein